MAKQMGSRVILGLSIIAFMFFGGLGILLFSAIPAYQKADALVHYQKSTQAMITDVWDQEEDNGPHGGSSTQRYASYSYLVNGILYTGKSQVSSNYNQNGPITIFYQPNNPANCAIDPKSKFTHALDGLLFGIAWILIVILIGIAIIVSNRRGGKLFRFARY